MANIIRQIVSQDKVRFSTNGFDLDLAYINRKIIAMSYPATGFSSSYRNPQKEVAQYFDMQHPGHYKIFNLSEWPYHQSLFTGPVEQFPFPDHHAPPFTLLLEILQKAHDWLQADPENVVAIHCIAGMGRTGTVISSLLLLEGIDPTADIALLHFASVRTGSEKGVSNPSQIRYVYYFYEHLLKSQEQALSVYSFPPAPSKRIEKIIIHNLCNKGPRNIYITILNSEWDVIYNSAWVEIPKEQNDEFEYFPSIDVEGDFTIQILEIKKNLLSTKSKEIAYITFNTSFLTQNAIHVPKSLIDGFYKDASNTKYSSSLGMTIIFVNGAVVEEITQ